MLLPLMDGSSARSAATADVMMLLGPPTRQPIKARRSSRMVTGMSFMYSANTQRRGHRIPDERERERERAESDVKCGRSVSGE